MEGYAEARVVSVIDMIGSAVVDDFRDALHLFDLRNDAVSSFASLDFVGRRKSPTCVNFERNPELSSINGCLEDAVAVDAAVFVICYTENFCNFLWLFESVDFFEKVVDVLDFHLFGFSARFLVVASHQLRITSSARREDQTPVSTISQTRVEFRGNPAKHEKASKASQRMNRESEQQERRN